MKIADLLTIVFIFNIHKESYRKSITFYDRFGKYPFHQVFH